MNKDKKYYISYGSNLNKKEMEVRCPTAEVVSVGELKGYQLQFNVYATIIKKDDGVVPIVMWEIDSECEKALDDYEGYPNIYHKEYITLAINNKDFVAMVYVINEDIKLQLPTAKYIDRMKKGYEDFGLDLKHIYNAVMFTLDEMNSAKK